MRLSPELIAAPMLFGGRDGSRTLHYDATAFLVGYPTALHPRIGSTALVTARDEVLRALEGYGNVWIRLNARDGRARDVEVTARWRFPDDPSVDAAAVPFHLPSSGWEAPPVATDRFVTDETLATGGVGPGDDVAVAGLFAGRVGSDRVLPLLRRGAIAALAREPLLDQATGSQFSAHLVELRSSTGLGGAPVFVALAPSARPVTGDASQSGTPQHRLLGLVRGHPTAEIAMITPAAELVALLESAAFVVFGKNMDRARARERGAGQLSGAEAAGRRSEFQRFEDLTRRLVQVPKTELDETPSR